jgi:hypothetical protein
MYSLRVRLHYFLILLFPQNYISEQRLGARRSKSLQRGVYILFKSNIMPDLSQLGLGLGGPLGGLVTDWSVFYRLVIVDNSARLSIGWDGGMLSCSKRHYSFSRWC